MTIDDLSTAIERASSEDASRKLIAFIQQWKRDDTPLAGLAAGVGKLIGNVWFEKDETHGIIYSAWASFRDDEIAAVGGMTMNERLFVFGLLERFDQASEDDRRRIYAKVGAAA